MADDRAALDRLLAAAAAGALNPVWQRHRPAHPS
jgi:hypothetical protein